MRILAIDENEDDLAFVAAMLKASVPGCEARTARSGAEGMEIAREFQPDAILLDVQIPGMDGFETCRRLKEDPSTRKIPVIFMTAQRGDGEIRTRCLEIGGDAILAKPLEAGELTAQIRATVRVRNAEDTLRAEKQSLELAVEARTRALRASEERFRVLFENAPVGYQSLDSEGRILVVNEAWCSLLGYAMEDVRGRWFGDFLVPEFRDRFLENFPRFKARGEILGIEFRMVRKDGSTVLVSFDGKIGHDEAGRFRQTHCVLSDITERKRSEEKLHDSEELLRLMFDQSPVGTALVSLDHRILRANEELCRITGYDPSELIGREFADITWPEDSAREDESAKRLTAGEIDGYDMDKRYVRMDGSLVWTHLTVQLMQDAAGRPLFFLSTVVDIADRKAAEERLREQVDELRRWHEATLGRESRVLELKREVNSLLAELGRAPRYASAVPAEGGGTGDA